ncbi:hypothetical protein [Streptomyces acidiscabies]|uniref:hypothetical protein n=1 Tax=Streptomyces acidiscabies TaxID=42234 RepID=UPI0038F7ABCF
MDALYEAGPTLDAHARARLLAPDFWHLATVGGEEALLGMDRLTRKYLGLERYPWLMAGERRVMLLIEPVRVRRVVGVEPFPDGVL